MAVGEEERSKEAEAREARHRRCRPTPLGEAAARPHAIGNREVL